MMRRMRACGKLCATGSSCDNASIFTNDRTPLGIAFRRPSDPCFGRALRLRPDYTRFRDIEIIEHVFASIEFLFEVLRCRLVSLRSFHRFQSQPGWITDVVLASL